MSNGVDDPEDSFSDLTDFGGGYQSDDANPEDEDNRLISEWLTRSGNDVYWDRKKVVRSGDVSNWD